MAKHNLTERLGVNSDLKTNSETVLYKYIDIDLDLAGWYALGHHNPAKILAEAQRKSFRKTSTPLASRTRVRKVWARFRSNQFEETERVAEGAQPITLIEVLDCDCFL